MWYSESQKLKTSIFHLFPLSSKTDAALLMVQAEEAQWVMKAEGYLRLEARAGVTDCAEWDLVEEETGV